MRKRKTKISLEETRNIHKKWLSLRVEGKTFLSYSDWLALEGVGIKSHTETHAYLTSNVPENLTAFLLKYS